MSAANNTALNILDVLRGSGAPDAIEAASEFTVSASAASAQVRIMAEAITETTLEDIDLSKATKQ